MVLKRCDKCSEMVDEAKAFCPGCGDAFVVEETRETSLSFETMDKTVQFGKSMYNLMLSDMGLSTSIAPDLSENTVVAEVATSPATEPKNGSPGNWGNRKWFILAGIGVLLLLLLAVGVGVSILIYWMRFS